MLPPAPNCLTVVVGRGGLFVAIICRTGYGQGVCVTPVVLPVEYSGYWSRRIDSRHRLIYQISDDGKALWIISCRFHYGQ